MSLRTLVLLRVRSSLIIYSGRLQGRASRRKPECLTRGLWGLHSRLPHAQRDPKVTSTRSFSFRSQARCSFAHRPPFPYPSPYYARFPGVSHFGLRRTRHGLSGPASSERAFLCAEGNRERCLKASSLSVRLPGTDHPEERFWKSLVCTSPGEFRRQRELLPSHSMSHACFPRCHPLILG